MTTEEQVDTAIESAVNGVKSYRSDNESAEGHSLKELLDAKDRIKIDTQTNVTNRRNSIQGLFAKIRPVN
jgi:hypothetical protein